MVFNLSNLDLVRVIQSLYRHSIPAGIGIGIHLKEGTDELTREECETLLMDGVKTIGSLQMIVIDYVKGNPIKFEYDRDKKLAYSTKYDVRNGKYKFFEALASEFGTTAVIVHRKKYPPYTEFENMENRKRELKVWATALKTIEWNNRLSQN